MCVCVCVSLLCAAAQLVMDVIFVVLLVLVCAEAARLTELSVQPSQHVTLNCSVDPGDLYWFMEIHSRLRVCIVRTFNSKPSNQVEPQTNKYEGVTGRSLLIRNITADDCRQYFCATKHRDRIQYEDTFNISCEYLTLLSASGRLHKTSSVS